MASASGRVWARARLCAPRGTLPEGMERHRNEAVGFIAVAAVRPHHSVVWLPWALCKSAWCDCFGPRNQRRLACDSDVQHTSFTSASKNVSRNVCTACRREVLW